MSTIWSSRARKRSFCPPSRRSLGRIESPSAKPTGGQNHDKTFRSICKKSNRTPSLSCKCKYLPIRANGSKIRRFRILHRRRQSRLRGGLAPSARENVAESGERTNAITDDLGCRQNRRRKDRTGDAPQP